MGLWSDSEQNVKLSYNETLCGQSILWTIEIIHFVKFRKNIEEEQTNKQTNKNKNNITQNKTKNQVDLFLRTWSV